jgi:hypothetical protein
MDALLHCAKKRRSGRAATAGNTNSEKESYPCFFFLTSPRKISFPFAEKPTSFFDLVLCLRDGLIGHAPFRTSKYSERSCSCFLASHHWMQLANCGSAATAATTAQHRRSGRSLRALA